MRLSSIRIRNYRSLEDVSISFPRFYTAICGKNDAGKTNIIRALRTTFERVERMFWTPEPAVIQFKDDFPKWKEQAKDGSADINLDFTIEVSRQDDEGLFRFIEDYVQVDKADSAREVLTLKLGSRYTSDPIGARTIVTIGDRTLEELKAQEIVKKFKSSLSIIFYDSTEFFHPYKFLESTALFREMSASENKAIADAKTRLDKAINRVAKRNQQDLTAVLGRLREKYKIGLRVPETQSSEVQYNITLGNQDLDVELEKWGSGTQNRTRILMSLFKAKQVRESQASPDKITPVLIIEEPESYLHPSAQAEFGKILQDLSEELKVQVIVTTHSPYLLSLSDPAANLLLERTNHKGKPRRTTVVDTANERWMEPFSLALGYSAAEIQPWKDVLFASQESVLLVEGDLDEAYLSFLRNDDHGNGKLNFVGSIFPYNGRDNLVNRQLIKLIKSKFNKFILTYDLDCEPDMTRKLEAMGLIKGKHFIAIGKPTEGKRDIEGLLPESVLKKVFADNVELVRRCMVPSSKEAKSAKNELKKLYLEEFKKSIPPKSDGCKDLYVLTKQLNSMFAAE